MVQGLSWHGLTRQNSATGLLGAFKSIWLVVSEGLFIRFGRDRRNERRVNFL